MPGLRAVLAAIGVGVIVGGYVLLWIRWPTFVAVAVGAFMAIVLLMIAASLGGDPSVADAAWRKAAPDLVTTTAGPDDDVPSSGSPASPDR